MPEVRSGLVFRYSYLWARQHERGEESGRKDRPVCVQVIVKAGAERLTMLFPVKSQPQGDSRAALEIPALEARRAGLRTPAWVIVDEWNEDDLEISPYLAEPNPLGEFSKPFAARIARSAAAAIRERRHKRVRR